MSTKADRDVNRVLKQDEGKTLNELDYAARNRLVLLYTMVHARQLVRIAKLTCFFIGVIALILVLWFLFGFVFRFTATVRPI
jgi:hypothetical protein